MPKFILASRSPQRKTILEDLGIEFTVIPSSFDESSIHEQDPPKRALILAEKKAIEVARKHPDQWIIGVDTLVVSEDGQLLEKPIDEEDARRMLKLHSGNTSTVHSAICLCRVILRRASASAKATADTQDDTSNIEKHTDLSTARVTFKDLESPVDWLAMSERQKRSELTRIEWWIETELWKDRSGSFQIDDEGGKLIENLEGEFETVVGFPVACFQQMSLEE